MPYSRLRARLHGEFQPVLPMSRLRGQKPHKKHLRLHEKNFSPCSRGEIPARSRQAGRSRLNGLKISPVIVFSPGWKCHAHTVFGMFAFITQTKMASAGSIPNLILSQTSDKSSKQRFKWNDGDKIDNLLTAIQNHWIMKVLWSLAT